MNSKKNILKIIIIIFLFLILFFFYKHHHSILIRNNLHRLKIHDIKRFLTRFGKWSIFIYILLYSIKPIFLIIPASMLSVAGGILYGPVYGTIYTLIGSFFASTLAFYISRFLGKDIVDKLLKGKVARLDSGIERNGFVIMLLLRLSVIFPLDTLSFAAGLSKMLYRDFIFGTMIGILPETIAYNYLGTNLYKPFSKGTIISLIIVLLLGAVPLTLKIIRRRETNK